MLYKEFVALAILDLDPVRKGTQNLILARFFGRAHFALEKRKKY